MDLLWRDVVDVDSREFEVRLESISIYQIESLTVLYVRWSEVKRKKGKIFDFFLFNFFEHVELNISDGFPDVVEKSAEVKNG